MADAIQLKRTGLGTSRLIHQGQHMYESECVTSKQRLLDSEVMTARKRVL